MSTLLIYYLIYLGIKLFTYTLWCWIGIRYLHLYHQSQIRSSAKLAMLFGTIRLLLGVITGLLGLALALIHLITSSMSIWVYFTVFIPIRWIEWSLLEIIMNRDLRTWKGFLLGAQMKSKYWRAFGIIMSYAADLVTPFILMLPFIPELGRIFC